MNAITTQTAKDNLDTLVDHAVTTPEPTILQNTDGKQAVLISLADFNAWQEAICLLSNPTNVAHLQQLIQISETQETVETIKTVTLRKEGERLIIEPIKPPSLLAFLATLDDISEDFPDVDEGLLPLKDITL